MALKPWQNPPKYIKDLYKELGIIDYKSQAELQQLAERRFNAYLHESPENNLQSFQEVEFGEVRRYTKDLKPANSEKIKALYNSFNSYAQIVQDLHPSLPADTKEVDPNKSEAPPKIKLKSKLFANYNEWVHHFKELKPKFESLETYADKLKFWDEHFWDEQGFFSFSPHYFFNEIDTKAERLKPENFITVLPANKEQTNLYNRWFLNHCLEQHYNFEKQKEKYFEVIEDNPQKRAYTEQKIEKIKLALEKDKASKQPFAKGLYIGYQSVITKNDTFLSLKSDEFGRDVLEFAKGICYAHFLGFLETQLELIKQGKQVLQGTVINSTGQVVEEKNLLKDTIDEYMEPFKGQFRNEKDYWKAVESLKIFFEGKKAKSTSEIFIKKGNKTKLAKALGKLYQMEKSEAISVEYLQLLKSLFSEFRNEVLTGKPLIQTNLYKYCTTKKKY